MTTDAQADALVTKMRANFPESPVSGYEPLIPAMTNHPKDRHVLAAAVAVHARVIVTSNLRDFPRDALAPHGIEALSPDEFLTSLFDEDPPLVLTLVRWQAAALTRPPQSFVHVLDRLARHTPNFVERLRDAANASSEP